MADFSPFFSVGREENVELLIKMGANVSATNSEGQTPLFIATRFGEWVF